MQTARLIALSFLLAAIAAPVFGQSAPEGFRDLKWGATREQVLLAFPSAHCVSVRGLVSDWSCSVPRERVDDVSVMIVGGGYTTGQIVGMSHFSLSFNSDDVGRIADAFKARYGKPSRVQEMDLVTKEGGRVPSKEWLWEFPDSMITLRQHIFQLGSAGANVTLRSAMEELRERTAQRKRGLGKGR
jgi:hypothetical protein